eukprot:12915998-Alexandrium_andersonii.AAC.1
MDSGGFPGVATPRTPAKAGARVHGRPEQGSQGPVKERPGDFSGLGNRPWSGPSCTSSRPAVAA